MSPWLYKLDSFTLDFGWEVNSVNPFSRGGFDRGMWHVSNLCAMVELVIMVMVVVIFLEAI